MSDGIDLATLATGLDEFWSQQVVASANGSLFKVAKGIGEVEWHQHDDQDEVFLVLTGELIVRLRDPEERAVPLKPGQLFVVPQGVQHAPVAADEASFSSSAAASRRPPRAASPLGARPAARPPDLASRVGELDGRCPENHEEPHARHHPRPFR